MSARARLGPECDSSSSDSEYTDARDDTDAPWWPADLACGRGAVPARCGEYELGIDK